MSDVAPSGGITSASLREAAPAPAGAAAAAPAAGGAAAGGAAAGGAKPPGDVHAEAVGGEEEDEEDEEEEEEEDEDGLGALGLGASTDEGSDDDEGEEEEEEEDEQTWVQWFCAIRSNAFLCEVDEEFITDDFNLTGLAAEVPYYDFALDTILDAEARHAEALTEAQQETVDMSAELLYGLVHARFVLTARGLAAVLDKFNAAAYGRCPRVYCEGQAVLPCGISDAPRKAGVALFCPRCNDIYQPKSAKQTIDGAFFGTTLPHLFLMTYPAAIPPPPTQIYVPRVFGFRVRRDLAALTASDAVPAPAAVASAPALPASLVASLGSLSLQTSGFAGTAPVRIVGVAGPSDAAALARPGAMPPLNEAAPLQPRAGDASSAASPTAPTPASPPEESRAPAAAPAAVAAVEGAAAPPPPAAAT